MDSHQPRTCKWDGCRSYDVVAGSIYCQEHRHQGRLLQTDNVQAFPTPSSNPSLGPPRDPTTIRLVNRGTENVPLNKPPLSGTPSPIKDKKQLSDKHTARKSVKPSTLGQAYIVSPVSPVRGPSIDTQSTNPRPAKKQRLSSAPNASELYSRSNSSSFSENGIPQSSKRGMFRQSEERTYKLSAVDDFALRPKKKEGVNESARSKVYNGQQQLHRGESHLSSSSRQTPPSSKPPQTTGINGSARSGSFVIDLTLDDDPEPPLPRLKPQISPKSNAPNGITTNHQHPQKVSSGNPAPPCDPRVSIALGGEQRRDGPPQPQPGAVPQIQPGRSVTESSNPRPQKPLEKIVPSASTVQTTLKPAKGTASETSISKQMPHSTALKKGTGPVPNSFPRSSTHQQDATHTKESQIVNETRHFTPINSPQGALQLQQIMKTRRLAKPTARAEPTPAPPVTTQTQAEARGVTVPRQTNGMHRPVQSVEQAPVPPINEPSEPQPIAKISQGPLSALLGGRVWKNMTPEERRLFWVSQHDPEKFDAHIYSENNRPFRPGDPLFGVAEDTLLPRPKRPAEHFDYIDPRTHYSHHRPEAWYAKKQKEVSARGNRKTNFGQVAKRVAQRKQAAPKPDPKHKQDSLPQRVRDNPKWLAALEVLEKLEAQARDKGASASTSTSKSTPQQERAAKSKAKAAIDAEPNSDVDMEII
ncbi:hypothetical protein GGR51DRAFT_281070 [Nemania sp. FL0031]|nr:hypothetical protein GGR51DRAFT_281070 [Nemania sp. FL0031]